MHNLSGRLSKLIDNTDIKNIDSFSVNVVSRLLQINLKNDEENLVISYDSNEELLHDLLALREYVSEKQDDVIKSIQSDIDNIDVKKKEKVKRFKKNKLLTFIVTLCFLLLNFMTLSIPFVFICLTAIICILGADAIILNRIKQMNYIHNLYFEKENLDIKKRVEINNKELLNRAIDKLISKVSYKLKYDAINAGKIVDLQKAFEEEKQSEVAKRLKLTL